ncbi:hypothetical protein [Brevundimonas sp.]|uniref:hypothetical protein n=1 Tax=Brevundimonas sp. TaxID=1871086 RepID=UPI003784FECC
MAYLSANLSGTIKCASELPWAQGDIVLYRQNMKRVYLDEPQTSQEAFVETLGALDLARTTTTVNGYLAVDAKNKPADLESALVIIKNAKDMSSMSNVFRKEFDYSTEIDKDVMIYTFEYRFSTIN